MSEITFDRDRVIYFLRDADAGGKAGAVCHG